MFMQKVIFRCNSFCFFFFRIFDYRSSRCLSQATSASLNLIVYIISLRQCTVIFAGKLQASFPVENWCTQSVNGNVLMNLTVSRMRYFSSIHVASHRWASATLYSELLFIRRATPLTQETALRRFVRTLLKIKPSPSRISMFARLNSI